MNYMKDKKINTYITAGEKVFFDTNILVYYVDEKDIRKQNIAKEIITNTVYKQNGIISSQCLQECR